MKICLLFIALASFMMAGCVISTNGNNPGIAPEYERNSSAFPMSPNSDVPAGVPQVSTNKPPSNPPSPMSDEPNRTAMESGL